MAAQRCHVWVGAETGILKGVNLRRKQATNFSEFNRGQEISEMCWRQNQVLLGCVDGTVKVFSTERGEFTEFHDCSGGEGPFRGLAAYNSSLITCTESGLLKVWKEDSTDQVQVGRGVCRMRQDPGRPERVATGGKENDLKVWDLQRLQEPVFKARNVRNDWLDLRVPIWVRDIQFIPASDTIITCTGHSQVRIYDPSCPQRRPVLEMTYDEYPLTAMSLTSDANSVVVGNTHGQMAVLDIRKGRLLKCLKGQAGSIRSIQCHCSLPLVASCGLDRFLRVHDTGSKELLHKVYMKSRLNCVLLTSRESWEEDEECSTAEEVKEQGEEDEIWASMATVTDRAESKRTADLQVTPKRRKRRKQMSKDA
ncbi:WD repeat-containing protein 74 isoform X2 [Rhincodon typus]|uniref:WD repeat-containing protein 74 isoform X2 n=1 Tax=Rhincodon typus TaxID=259920 RepID=UPI002030F48D|nr:WD repeat-containing protein 74 isoform X2 [Rhincodon typus]